MMKVIPCLRLVCGGQLLINRFSNALPASFEGASLLSIFHTMLIVTFFLYCVVIAFQEIMGRQFVEGKYFYFFGLFFQLFLFMGGLYVLNIFRGTNTAINWMAPIQVTSSVERATDANGEGTAKILSAARADTSNEMNKKEKNYF